MAEVNILVIRKTQELLGKHVKKPALSEKLLKKPPFRFLHDVINVIIKETGYLEGVYTEQELQFENVKEKEAKIEFLQKLIDAVKETSKDKLKAKPSKIVAGLEPERTNELLQAIGKAVDARQKEPNNNIVEPKASAASIKPSAIGKSKSSKTQSNPKEVNANSTKVAAKPVSSVQSESKLSLSAASVKQTKVTSRPTRAHDTKDKPPSIKVSKEKVVIKEPEIILQRSSTTTILREGETKQDPIENVVSNDHHDAAPIKDNSPLPDDKTKVDDQGNINTKVVPMDETLGTNSSFETDAKNLTQVLSNTSVSIDTKPTETALPTSSTSDLIDVIDQEAEIRRRERSSKKHRETKSTAGQSIVAQDNPSVVAVDSPVVEEIKSSKPRKSLKIKRAISGEDVQEVVVVPQSTVRASSTEDHEPPAVPLVRPRTSLRPPSVRPASARPGAPRRRDKNVEIFLQPDDAANHQAAGNGRPSTFPEVDLEDDGDNLIVIEDPMVSVVDTMNGKNKGDLNGGNLGTASTSDDTTGHTELSDERGHLVQQILQTQKEFSKQDDNKEVINNTDNEFTTNHQRQSSAKQMDMLRDSIQTLTRSVNPLGKLMDFLQEDIDSMQMELAAWRRTYITTKAELKRETSLNESAVEPLKQQLAQIEITIREHIELTNESRLNMLQNEDKIFKLLGEI